MSHKGIAKVWTFVVKKQQATTKKATFFLYHSLHIDYQVDNKRERLSEAMTFLKMSQTTLAQTLGIDRSAVNKMLSGNRVLGRNTSMNIIAKLNLNPNWWETGEGDMFLPKSAAEEPTLTYTVESENEKRLAAELIEAQKEVIRLTKHIMEQQEQENQRLAQENERLRKDLPHS